MTVVSEVLNVLYLSGLFIIALLSFAIIQMSPLLLTVGLFVAWCGVIVTILNSARSFQAD